MKRAWVALLGCLLAAYPLIVLFGLKVVPVVYLGAFFIVLAVLRLWFLRSQVRDQTLPVVLCIILILVALYATFSGQPDWFRYYPVAVNGTLLSVFLASLWHGPPMVERMARVADPNLPEIAVRYTRKVTVAWCCFFILNGLVALYTALWTSFEIWAWYNGAFAYALMGAFFAVEWMLRRRVQRKVEEHERRQAAAS